MAKRTVVLVGLLAFVACGALAAFAWSRVERRHDICSVDADCKLISGSCCDLIPVNVSYDRPEGPVCAMVCEPGPPMGAWCNRGTCAMETLPPRPGDGTTAEPVEQFKRVR